jgi:transcriptional regulator with XRE-family HTH domain
MATIRSLTAEQSACARKVAKGLVDALGSQAAVAEAIGITPGGFSQFITGKAGAGPQMSRRIAFVAKVPIAEVIGDHSLDENTADQTESRVERDHVRMPTFGALPGWPEAEAEARVKFRKVPEEAWVGARGLAGFTFPEHVTPDFVRWAARAWEEAQELAAQQSPEQKAAERAEERRLEQLHEELEAAKKTREKK